MSVFLELLRWILCCVDENWYERDESSYSHVSSSPSSYPSISSKRTPLLSPSLLEPPTSTLPPFQAPIEAYISTKPFPSHHLPPKFSLKPASSAAATPSASRDSPFALSPSQPLKPNLLSVPSDSSPISKPASGSTSLRSSAPKPSLCASKKKPILLPSLSIPFQSSQNVASLSSKPFTSEASASTIKQPIKSSFETKTSPIAFQPTSLSAATLSCTSPSKPAPSIPSNSSNQKKSSKWAQKGMPPILKSFSGSSSLSCKPTLFALPPKSTDGQEKICFEWVQKGTLPIYMSPEDIKHLIEKDIVPEVLKKPLSPSTYKDYFAALLYSEDLYIEKWSKFHLSNVTIELRKAADLKKSVKKNESYGDEVKDEKMFAVFEIDKVQEKRPFLLSRDFVFAGSPNKEVKQFQGFVYRVVGGNSLVVEFQEDFHCQHHTSKRYDISFSFNRECLKRAHKALEAVLDDSFLNFLFPDPATREGHLRHPVHDHEQNMSAIQHMSSFQGPPPHLVRGPRCLQRYVDTLSKTGNFLCQAILHMYRTLPDCRILICAPQNKTCDLLMRRFRRDIPEPDIFRANAAFREKEEVPDDIRSSCPHEGERFVCPSVSELKKYRVILSTFMSAYRLRRQGLRAGHFTHIFLVDASSATEPEMMVALSGLVDNNTSVIVSGDNQDHPNWIRSGFARQNGLRTSYFERLYRSEPYATFDSVFVTDLYGYAVSTECYSSAYL